MSKSMKRFISIVIALIMMLTVSGLSAFAATKDNVKKYQSYASIGDSIAAGYSLAGYEMLKEVPGSYPSLLKTDVGATTYNQLANIGFRSSEVRLILDPDYTADDIAKVLLPGMTNGTVTVNNLSERRAMYIAALKDADLVTIGLGSNDIIMPLIFVLYQIAAGSVKPLFNDTMIQKFADQLKKEGSMPAMMQTIYDNLEKINLTAGQLKAVNDALINSYITFTKNYNYIVKYILTINPDVKIVTVGLYSPLRNMKLNSSSNIKIGRLASLVLDRYNDYTHYLSPYASKTTYVDVPDTEVYDSFNLDEIGANDTFVWKLINDIHPTPAGHQYIENQIIKALPEA